MTVEQPGVRRGRWAVILILALAAVSLFAALEQLSTRKSACLESNTHSCPRGGDVVLKLDGINDAQEIFGGVRSAGARLGDPDAPVAIQVFNDVQCSSCRDQFLSTIPPLVTTEVRNGDVQLLYRNYSFSLDAVGQGFIGDVAAGNQGYEWPYVYLLFRNQPVAERLGGVTGDLLSSIAGSIEELDVPQWEKDFANGGGADGSITEDLKAEDKVAQGLGLRAQPSAIISGPSGTETLQDSPTLHQIRAAISRVE